MKPIAMPTYQDLNAALSKTALKLHPSQVHGLISGILSANAKNNAAWEEIITGGEEAVKTHELLQALYDTTANQLSDFLFEFQLVLPPDSEDLALRAEALTLWCQGFLTGLKSANIKIVGREPSDMTEAINDLIEIAKMNYEDVVASEEDEAAFVELMEYVRMAVILIYQESHPDSETPAPTHSSSNQLH